jgi:hypothetical protein
MKHRGRKSDDEMAKSRKVEDAAEDQVFISRAARGKSGSLILTAEA